MSDAPPTSREDGTPLRRGWTTGACATAAVKSALSALLGNGFLDPVEITLPGGQTPAFALSHEALSEDWAEAGITKDAGDDPDVTHGAAIIARVKKSAPGSGISFAAGPGVGTVTKAGLPLAIGEPAINPVPRKLITEVIETACKAGKIAPDISVTISVPGGEALAEKTWNPRLGILGGLSILGTTGIVVPYSCSAWIHSIQRGVDVARAAGMDHLVGSAGNASETAAMQRFQLPIECYIDMGDFVGGFLKYVRENPVKTVTIAGGFAKLSKLANGAMDLHSARSTVDLDALATMLESLGASADLAGMARTANTASEVLGMAVTNNLPLAKLVADRAREKAQAIVRNQAITVQIVITDRSGAIIAESR